MPAHPKICELFTNAATGLAVTDPTGKLIHANASLARIVDCTPAELNGCNLFELTHPEDQLGYRKLLDKLLAAEIPAFVIEKRYLRRSGSVVWVRNSVSLMDDEQSSHLVSICEDISKRKQAEKVLEQQEQMAAIGRLTSSIVHEINNPLEAVLNLVYLAQHAKNLDEATPFLRDAEQELVRACDITTQGLQFHRQHSAPTSANMVHIVQSVLTLFKGRFKTAGVRVDFHVDDAPELMCFAGEMRQVIVNLIGNAVESMEHGGVLTIRIRPGTDWRSGRHGVRVTIADTGSGMTLETRHRMYEPFYTTKGSSGSGLGLWVTAKIVSKHQGRMHVRSKRHVPVSGTVFTLIFPYAGAAGKTAGYQEHAA